ncbi:hypothetical protein PAMP_021433 [Pampus punctatissimus]
MRFMVDESPAGQTVVVWLQKPLCHRTGDAGDSVITGEGEPGSVSPSLCFSPGLLYSRLPLRLFPPGSDAPMIVPNRTCTVDGSASSLL